MEETMHNVFQHSITNEKQDELCPSTITIGGRQIHCRSSHLLSQRTGHTAMLNESENDRVVYLEWS